MGESRIGFMQGRLSPCVDGKIQAFPSLSWRSEFPAAAREGFSVIEWVFEEDGYERNPLWTDRGTAEISSLVREHGVEVESVCADYFMTRPFFRGTRPEKAASRDVLRRLVDRCAVVGARLLEIPLVDSSSLRSPAEADELLAVLRDAVPSAAGRDVALTLETDLPPARFRELLSRCPKGVGANYDIGNSASLGYDPDEEVPTLGPYIANVHVKDRVRGGGTVPLGRGNADLPRVFHALARAGYGGSYVLQTARDADDVGAARRYRAMVSDWLRQAQASTA